MMTHPAILEASAVAVPDKTFGEVVGAWVVRRPNQFISREEVRKIVSESICPQASVLAQPEMVFAEQYQGNPTWVWFAGEDGVPIELPKTTSGKIQKHILRTWGREMIERGIGRTQ